MAEQITFQNNKLLIYQTEESCPNKQAADFVIQRVSNLDAERCIQLRKQGYFFHDRRLRCEILRGGTGIHSLHDDMEIRFETRFSKEIYELAYQVFPNDRRFHLWEAFDSNKAVPVIEAYIDWCIRIGCNAAELWHGEELLAFMILQAKNQTVENLLGAVRNGLRGKMAAMPFYSQVIRQMSQNGYNRYIGNVSTTNIGSLNLHYALGGKVTGVYDEFIYRNK